MVIWIVGKSGSETFFEKRLNDYLKKQIIRSNDSMVVVFEKNILVI